MVNHIFGNFIAKQLIETFFVFLNKKDKPPTEILKKSNRKRCRYTEQEIDILNKRNLEFNMNKNQHNSNPNSYIKPYYNLKTSDDRYGSSYNFVKQPKVRDQHNSRLLGIGKKK